jgi:hypothetical protein
MEEVGGAIQGVNDPHPRFVFSVNGGLFYNKTGLWKELMQTINQLTFCGLIHKAYKAVQAFYFNVMALYLSVLASNPSASGFAEGSHAWKKCFLVNGGHADELNGKGSQANWLVKIRMYIQKETPPKRGFQDKSAMKG